MRKVLLLLALLWPVTVYAQPAALVGTTVRTTSTAATSVRVGCTQSGTCTGGIIAGPIDVASVTSSGFIGIANNVPGVTTFRLYNDAGTLKWNGSTVAIGGSISGTTGAIAKFTASNAVGDSIMTESGTTITVASTLNATTLGGTLSTVSQPNVTTMAGLVSIGTITTGVWSGTVIGLSKGGTGVDLSGTGGTSQFLRQNTVGATVTVVRPAVSDLSDSANVALLDAAVNTFTGRANYATTSAVTSVGDLGYNSTFGSYWFTKTGATNDFTVFDPAGNAAWSMPVGTRNFVGAGSVSSVTTMTVGTILTVNGFGTHAFSGGSNGSQILSLQNTTSGTAALTRIAMTAGTSDVGLFAFSQGFTTSNEQVASGGLLQAEDAGGLSIAATSGSGALRFYTGGTAVRWGVNAAGDFTYGASSHISDSVGTPARASGCGGGTTIAGTDYAFIMTKSTGTDTTCVVTFGHTWSTTPICTVSVVLGNVPVLTVVPSTLNITLGYASSAAAESFQVLCRSY